MIDTSGETRRVIELLANKNIVLPNKFPLEWNTFTNFTKSQGANTYLIKQLLNPIEYGKNDMAINIRMNPLVLFENENIERRSFAITRQAI